MTPGERDEILTLEPLIDAIREAIEDQGWELSGLQKTTSHQFEGRWEGDSTRSAYVFFHPPDGPDFVSVDVYLDETPRGLSGNIALVADLLVLGQLGSAEGVLESLRHISSACLDSGHQRPVTLRFRLSDADLTPDEAESEVRFKVRLPRATIASGAPAVSRWVRDIMSGFERILDSAELRAVGQLPDDDLPMS